MLAVLVALAVEPLTRIKNLATPEVAMVATDKLLRLFQGVQGKERQPVNLEKPMETCIQVVEEVVTVLWLAAQLLVLVVLAVAALAVTMAKQTPEAVVVVTALQEVQVVQEVPVSLSSASIRRRQHEIRNRN